MENYQALLQISVDQSYTVHHECVKYLDLRDIMTADPAMYSDTSLPLEPTHKCVKSLNKHIEIFDHGQAHDECNKLCHLLPSAHDNIQA